MDTPSWISEVSTKTVANVLAALILMAGALLMGWAKEKGWRWAAPLLYALVAGEVLYLFLFGFLSQGGVSLGWWGFVALMIFTLGFLRMRG